MLWQKFTISLISIQENINAVAFLLVFFFLLIWRPEVTPHVRFNYEMAFSWVALTAFSFFIASRFNLWIGLFMLLATWSATYPVNSFFSNQAQQLLFQGVLLIWIGKQVLTNDRVLSWALNVICIITLIHAYYLICQWLFGFHPDGSVPAVLFRQPYDPSPTVGIVSNYNEAAALLAIGAMAFFRKYWKWCLIVIVPLFVAAHSFGGPLTFTIGALAGYFLIKPKIVGIEYHPKLLFFLMILSSIPIFIYWMFIDPPGFGRLQVWKAGFGLFKDKWLFGCGIGHWKVAFLREDLAEWVTSTKYQWMAHAHNEYVQFGVEMGVLSIVFIFGFIIETLIRTKRTHPLPVMAFLVIISYAFIYHIFHNGIIAGVCVLWLSILFATIKPSRLLADNLKEACADC